MSETTAAVSMLPAGFRFPTPSLRRMRRVLDWKSAVQRRRLAPVRNQYFLDLWHKAAAEIGGECTQHRSGMMMIRREGVATFVRGSELMLDTDQAKTVAGDRTMSFDMIAARGLPVPRHMTFTKDTLDQAEQFLVELRQPVVVKPMAGTGGGRGVTTGIACNSALRRAARYASGYGNQILIEEEIKGASYRLTYLDGKLLDVVRRDPPTVIGNGSSTIAALISAENGRRRTGPTPVALSPLRLDDDMRNTMSRSGINLRTRPAVGQTVVVKGAVNENASRDNHNVSDAIHPDTVQRLRALVQDMGVRFAGVDLISEDIGRPLSDPGTVVSEVNVNPGLHHHYLISDPDRITPVATLALEYMISNRTRVFAL